MTLPTAAGHNGDTFAASRLTSVAANGMFIRGTRRRVIAVSIGLGSVFELASVSEESYTPEGSSKGKCHVGYSGDLK